MAIEYWEQQIKFELAKLSLNIDNMKAYIAELERYPDYLAEHYTYTESIFEEIDGFPQTFCFFCGCLCDGPQDKENHIDPCLHKKAKKWKEARDGQKKQNT